MHLNLMPLLALAFVTNGYAQTSVTNTRSAQHPDTGVVILGGEIELSSAGVWSLADQGIAGIGEPSLVVPQLISDRNEGERVLKQKEKRARERDRNVLQRIFRHLQKYARKHDGVGPASLEFLEGVDVGKPEIRDNYFLIPSVKILEQKDKRWNQIAGQILLVELNPLVDDGQHWVATSDGRVSLVPIDRSLIEAIRADH